MNIFNEMNWPIPVVLTHKKHLYIASQTGLGPYTVTRMLLIRDYLEERYSLIVNKLERYHNANLYINMTQSNCPMDGVLVLHARLMLQDECKESIAKLLVTDPIKFNQVFPALLHQLCEAATHPSCATHCTHCGALIHLAC